MSLEEPSGFKLEQYRSARMLSIPTTCLPSLAIKMELPSSLTLSMSHAEPQGCVTIPLMAFLVLTAQLSDSLISNDLHLYSTSAVHTHATPNRSAPLSAFQTLLASCEAAFYTCPFLCVSLETSFLPLSFPCFPLWEDEGGMRWASPFRGIPESHSGTSLCTVFFENFQTRSFLRCFPPAALKSTKHCRKLHKN